MSKLLFIFDRDNDDFMYALEERDKEGIKATLQTAFECSLEDNRDGNWRVGYSANTESYIFGFETADDVIQVAEQWNRSARENFTKAHDTYIRNWGDKFALGNDVDGLDNDETFRLRMAVSVLDNYFSPVCEMFICVEQRNAIVTVMSDELLEHIRQNPELCVVTNVECY